MIITNLIGGLGNQMFQYAAGLALSLELGTSLAISVDMFESYDLHHGFELERVFGIATPQADPASLRRLIGLRSSPLARRVLAKVPALDFFCGQHFLAERYNTTTDQFFSMPSDTYLHGYWQSDRFFGRHSDRVREALVFAEAPDKLNKEVLAQIADGPSVSVHVRRGDYLNAKNAAIYNKCTPEYFLSSMALMQKRFGALKFFVFSDDPSWTANFFDRKGFDFNIVAHNRGVASYNDMRLMSACDHHIIANSTFSWWGAWLNPKPNKLVIAPHEWIAGVPSSRIVPETWITL